MKKLLGISYFSYICLFWVRDPNLLTESAGTVLPVSLSSVSSFSWLLKICLSHWNLSRHFSHWRFSQWKQRKFPKLMGNIKAFFSKNKQKKSNQHGSQNPLTKTKSPREGKVPDLKWISCPLIFLTSFTLSLQQIRDPESTLFPHSHKHPPPQISCTLRLGSNKGSGRNYTYQLENSHCVRNTINPGAVGQDTNSCCREQGIGWKPLTDPKLVN